MRICRQADLSSASDDGSQDPAAADAGAEAQPRPGDVVAAAADAAAAAAAEVPPRPAASGGSQLPGMAQRARPAEVRPAQGRRAATASIVFEGMGSICYYEARGDFIASCFCPEHRGRCAKTRTSNARAGRDQQGRPLGYLAAWLFEGAAFASTAQHMLWDPRNESGPSYEARLSARCTARAQFEEFEALEEHERSRREGEGEEPAECP